MKVKMRRNKSKDFTIVETSEFYQIFNTLTPAAAKVYFYMSKVSDGIVWNLNYQQVSELLPMSERTYASAIAELKKSGYLVGDEFYAVSQKGIARKQVDYGKDSLKDYNEVFKKTGSEECAAMYILGLANKRLDFQMYRKNSRKKYDYYKFLFEKLVAKGFFVAEGDQYRAVGERECKNEN